VPWINAVDPARNLVRNAPLAISVGWGHTGRDVVHAVYVGLRALPPPLRRWIAARTPDSTLAALTLAADGRRGDALRSLERPSMARSPRRLRRAIAMAAALDAPDVAGRLLSQLDQQGHPDQRLAALVAARLGHLRQAEDLARQAGWRARGLRRRLAGELAALAYEPTAGTGSAGTTASAGTGSSGTGSAAGTRPVGTRAAAGPVPGRILHLVTNALPEVTAGYTVRTHSIALAQRRAGLDAQVATRLGFPVTAGAVAAPREVSVDGVPYHRSLPVRWLQSRPDRALAQDIRATARLVRQLRPALLHAHSKYVNGQVALALREDLALPVIYEVRGFLEETWRSRGHGAETDTYRLARDAETRCMQAVDLVVTLGEVMREEIVDRGVPADQVLVVPNSVDDRFLAPPPDPADLRKELGIAPDEVAVGVISTLNAYEGIDTLVDAVAVLRRGKVPVRLVVVGSGPVAAALRDQAAARGIEAACVFTGRVPFGQIRTYHACLDVFCVPRSDVPVCRLVTPLKPLEAMATGRPVVASDLPPLREIVDDQRTGLLTPPGDADALAERLHELACDPDRRTRMGDAARQWVTAHRSWTDAAAVYRAAYEKLGAV
jgi:glycosyltransferase involved in cell wall biosynthesis